MTIIEPVLFQLKTELREALRKGELLRQQALLNKCDKVAGEKQTQAIQKQLESEKN